MIDKQYQVGEIAAVTGLTIRTLQHYDNIGLLPASGRTESGKRYYSEADLVRLEQIIFYKLLDFTLDEIKQKLIDSPGRPELKELLKQQEYFLLRKIEKLHTAFVTIDASIKVIDAGRQPPFHVLLKFIKTLPGDDVFEWAPALLSEEQQAAMSGLFQDWEDAQKFYHKLKMLLIDAIALLHSGFSPADEQAQGLAKQWLDLLLSVSDGNLEQLEQFIEIGRVSEQKLLGNRQMMEAAYEFIDQALACHATQHKLDLQNPGAGRQK